MVRQNYERILSSAWRINTIANINSVVSLDNSFVLPYVYPLEKILGKYRMNLGTSVFVLCLFMFFVARLDDYDSPSSVDVQYQQFDRFLGDAPEVNPDFSFLGQAYRDHLESSASLQPQYDGLNRFLGDAPKIKPHDYSQAGDAYHDSETLKPVEDGLHKFFGSNPDD